MKHLRHLVLLCFAAAFAAAATAPAAVATVPADPQEAFSAGVAAYEKNDFAQARQLFAAVEKKSVSPALEFNFGNACYQAGDYSGAILHYLRALAMDPRDPDAQQNLALARKGANLTAPDSTRLDRFSGLLSQDAWTWVATVSGWVTLYLLFLPRLFRWRGTLPWLLCLTTLGVSVAAGIGWWGAHQHANDGVVLVADTPVKLSPTTNSPSLAMLQPGEIAQVLDRHGDYYKVLTGTGQLGWVASANYAPVRE
ncbi:MAG TPA: tetratricopeptide repeat protein [Opitutales bacterium]|nr:tetratricopeptide repeat protein [Opitutales bacterium]